MSPHARPVFVDRTGRRRRAVVLFGAGLGVLLVVSVVVLLAGLVTGSPVPVPGWPDSAQQKDQVVPVPSRTPGAAITTRGPDRTVKPTTATTKPPAAPTAAAPTTTRPGNGGSHGRPTKSPGKP